MPEQIPCVDLIPGRWYVGRGRRGNVGLWDGTRFLTIAEKFGELVIKSEPYYTEETGTFQPFAVVDEGVMVEPLGWVGWDAHYGRRMEFGIRREDGSPIPPHFPSAPIPPTAVGAEADEDTPDLARLPDLSAEALGERRCTTDLVEIISQILRRNAE